jgi:hypothetical protein
MPYVPFGKYFPHLAEQETQAITLPDDRLVPIPLGEYGLLEMFCDEANCDCRRVMLSVASTSEERIVAVVAYGWESRAFYERWLGEKNDPVIKDLQGPALNLASPQAHYAPALLKLISTVVLQDQAYVERIKRHYALFREKIEKGHKRRRRS